jgi:eukaryotic-like serine/threonine-protein kinase
MIGKTVAHYRILEKIGEGGMGVVYKAEDTKLKRTVALKFLPTELTRDAQARARFVQEAQAAAALDHPNICAVFEIGEAEGATYIAMPYVKGQSLKERIAAGPLSIEEVLAIAGQVAEGLKEAHERGIIHRDIKPANIMLTEKGQTKIMDFGLAKLESGADLTRTMAVIGTAAYMSPEQARGEEVDLRTDIWSFGATLYEMLTGKKPFGQRHDQALIYSILSDTTETLSKIRPEIPNYLDRVIQKALEKDRSRRYQSMAELLKDLKSTGVWGMSVPKVEKSIIVLPFENISPDPDQEYFCDGMTEEIITDLSHVHDLLVISRSSAMTFKGTKKTIPEIARAVNVRYVLEGSVRKAGNSLRITAQLIDALNDAHLWADKFSGTLDDVFDMQDKVSRSIVEALRLRLTQNEDQQIAKKPLVDMRAYDCYLRARREIYRFTDEGFEEAKRLLRAGLNIVGDNALIYAGLGYTHLASADIGMKPIETIDKAGKYAEQALRLDPETSTAHLVLGYVQMMHGNQRECIRHCKRALSIDPNDYDANLWLGMSLCFVGKMQEVFPIAQRMIALDPLNPVSYWMETFGHFFEGRFLEAYESLKRDPLGASLEVPVFRLWLAYSLTYANLRREALALLDQATETLKTEDFVLRSLPLLRAALQGDRRFITEMITADLVTAASIDCMKACFLMSFYAIVGDKEMTLKWLEAAVGRGLINYPFYNNYDPFLAKIRGEPRFQKLMERVKYEWEHFEA